MKIYLRDLNKNNLQFFKDLKRIKLPLNLETSNFQL
jgi:hypothetical protein